jgi:ABC-type bacteriocin/lantibiotic exporter with double-glycine peptidase domain
MIVCVGLFDPAVVLLDEPIAGLGLATESAVSAALGAELVGCTVLVATHRPAVVRVSALWDGRFRGVVPS